MRRRGERAVILAGQFSRGCGGARCPAISLATKIAIIDAVESGKVKSEVAKSFDLPRSSLSTILRNKERLRELYCCRRSLLSVSECVQLHEKALFIWLRQARSMNVPFPGPILKVKAKELALKLGHCDLLMYIAQDGLKNQNK